MSKEYARAGKKLGGQEQEKPVRGQATLQAAELHLLKEGGRVARYRPGDCLLDL